VGLTVIVKVLATPGQVLPALVKLGVTVIFAVMGKVPVFVAVKAVILPEPLAVSPIAVLSFVQLYVVPATPPVKFIALAVALLHIV
jgi:hypothetical protein